MLKSTLLKVKILFYSIHENLTSFNVNLNKKLVQFGTKEKLKKENIKHLSLVKEIWNTILEKELFPVAKNCGNSGLCASDLV